MTADEAIAASRWKIAVAFDAARPVLYLVRENGEGFRIDLDEKSVCHRSPRMIDRLQDGWQPLMELP